MYTGEQIRDGMKKAGITRVFSRDCSICGYDLCWIRKGDYLFFDSGCNCVTYSCCEPRSWSEIADWLNAIDDPNQKEKWFADFGINLKEKPCLNCEGVGHVNVGDICEHPCSCCNEENT